MSHSYEQQRRRAIERTDTPEPPVEPGDTVLCHSLPGVPLADYPIVGTVTRVEPQRLRESFPRMGADWYVRVKFDKSECRVHGGTSESFFIGRRRPEWEESNLELPE